MEVNSRNMLVWRCLPPVSLSWCLDGTSTSSQSPNEMIKLNWQPNIWLLSEC